jgi:hypothetical protein
MEGCKNIGAQYISSAPSIFEKQVISSFYFIRDIENSEERPVRRNLLFKRREV